MGQSLPSARQWARRSTVYDTGNRTKVRSKADARHIRQTAQPRQWKRKICLQHSPVRRLVVAKVQCNAVCINARRRRAITVGAA
jgi:hypothetical protein